VARIPAASCGQRNGIDASGSPPLSFVARADGTRDGAPGRHGEFIAGLAAERARLQVANVVRVGWLATADQAGLLCDKAKVLPVAIASGAAAASTLLSMPTDRSELVVAILLASHSVRGQYVRFPAAQRIPTFGRMSSRCRSAIKGVGVALRPSA
jgi:hypothetical protein